MTEFRATICLSPDALDSALGHNVTGIALGEGFVPVTEIAGYDPEELPDFTIAFGGIRALKGFGRVRYDEQAQYVVAQEGAGRVHDLGGASTPIYIPADHPNTSLITLPVPETWEGGELSATLFRGLHTQHNALVLSSAFIGAGAVGGALVGTAVSIRAGGLTPEAGAATGGIFGGLAGGALVALANPVVEGFVQRKENRARTYRAFDLTAAS
jgi:hypothetical protein